jgi:hypothetical protein
VYGSIFQMASSLLVFSFKFGIQFSTFPCMLHVLTVFGKEYKLFPSLHFSNKFCVHYLNVLGFAFVYLVLMFYCGTCETCHVSRSCTGGFWGHGRHSHGLDTARRIWDGTNCSYHSSPSVTTRYTLQSLVSFWVIWLSSPPPRLQRSLWL